MITRGRYILFTCLTVFLALIISVVAAELIARYSRLKPPIQILRDGQPMKFDLSGGVPVWEWPDSAKRQNLECLSLKGSRAVKIMVFGDSILYGSALDADRTFAPKLEKKLDATGRQFCLMNFAQPAISLQSMLILAGRKIREYRPDIIYWGTLARGSNEYIMIGDSAYDYNYLKIGADGYPAVFGLPAPMNRLLFKNSRLFEYLSLRLSQRNNIELGREWERKVVPRIPEIAELAKSAGAKLVFVHYPTRLDKSFRQIVENPQAEHKVYLDAAKKYGMDVLRLDEAFSDLDYREITIDLAGHYNEKGHEAIAEALYRKTLKLLDPAPDR